MRSSFILFLLPFPKFSYQLFSTPELPPSIGLLRIGLVAPLNLAVDFRTCGRDMPVIDAQIRQVPGELGAEGRIVVCLDALDRKGQARTNLLQRKPPLSALANSPDAGNKLHI